ncbi:hypothetical protein [Ruegeria sp. HKCCD6119]|uniref:hypothetical protein n=1 Tax=Ruegeria sp. HKCCD6119 TaxID=2683003 RepID=UPI00149209BF|nr:hypothetical protein [Ruegeria sp. HKCCD6119]NOD86369.1 hypothetical protein [Ruegeria sp. HKCCD6119]
MSRFLSPSDTNEISGFLSAPRLGTFQALTKQQKPEDAIELHQATMSLGVSIMAVTGLIEVAIRNSACNALNDAFQVSDWLTNPPTSLNWSAIEISSIKKATKNAQRAKYSKLTGQQKSALDAVAFPNGKPQGIKHRKIAEKRQSTIAVSEGEIVAQLTMHFWKRLFSDNYENTLWKRGLKRVFPNKQLSRAAIAKELEVIYQTRNRLAHHEPVYGGRLSETLYAIDFVSKNLGSRKPSTESPFHKLVLPQLDILAGQVAIFRSTFTRLS